MTSKLKKLTAKLKGNKAKLGLATALIQAANFAILVVAKVQISVDDFAFLLTQLAVAGIVGAVATLRFEVLIFQAHGRMTYAAAYIAMAAAAVVVGVFVAATSLLAASGFDRLVTSAFAIPMMLGLGLSAAQSFLFIQVGEMTRLLMTRACQAAALGLLTAALILDLWEMQGEDVLLLIGLCYLAPSIIWMLLFLIRFQPERADLPIFYIPDRTLIKRSVSVSLSTGVNAVYVNLPLLAAAATQTNSFVADFGLILRCFTAPVTFIRQVIGQLFLADAISWSNQAERTTHTLKRMVSKTIVQSVAIYLAFTPLVVALLYFNTQSLDISHFYITPFLLLAVIGQCAVNPVSQVRIPLSDEKAFLYFDVFRLAALAFGLFILSHWIPYAIAFSAVAVSLYAGYIFFIHHRIAHYGK